MFKITCLTEEQFETLTQLLYTRDVKYTSDPPEVPGRVFEPLSLIVDFDEFVEAFKG